jgi:hypothetical protein
MHVISINKSSWLVTRRSIYAPPLSQDFPQFLLLGGCQARREHHVPADDEIASSLRGAGFGYRHALTGHSRLLVWLNDL